MVKIVFLTLTSLDGHDLPAIHCVDTRLVPVCPEWLPGRRGGIGGSDGSADRAAQIELGKT